MKLIAIIALLIFGFAFVSWVVQYSPRELAELWMKEIQDWIREVQNVIEKVQRFFS